MSRLYEEFQQQENMVNIAPHEDPSPSIATGTTDILQEVITQNSELMRLLSA